MKELILIMAAAAVFGYGYAVMGKVDGFFAKRLGRTKAEGKRRLSPKRLAELIRKNRLSWMEKKEKVSYNIRRQSCRENCGFHVRGIEQELGKGQAYERKQARP